jgi:hypothetical protein
LLVDGCPWLLVVLLCVVALCSHVIVSIKTPQLKQLAGMAILVVSSVMFWSENAASLYVRPRLVGANEELPQVLADFNKAFGTEWLIVTGHRGYEVMYTAGQDIPYVYHTLSLYPEVMLKRTRGKGAYLLVPLPEGADRWEDINLKFSAAFDDPPPFAVYQRTWRYWRLWRLVRLDETDRE